MKQRKGRAKPARAKAKPRKILMKKRRPVPAPKRRDDQAAAPKETPLRIITEFDDPPKDGKVNRRVTMENLDGDDTFEKTIVETDTDLRGDGKVKETKTFTVPITDGKDLKYDKYVSEIDTDGDGKPDVVERGEGLQRDGSYRNVSRAKIKQIGM